MPEKKELSRLEQMMADGIEPEMPECDAAYLAEYLWQVGPTEAGGMGPAPLSHVEIAAWQNNTGVDLTSWEARMLRSLSLAYLGEADKAKAPACPSPLAVVLTNEARKQLPGKIRDALRG